MKETDTDMTASERLVQQFIDSDLAGEERIRLLVRMGRDQALREHVIDLERLTLSAARLPRPMVPHDFVTRVMQRAVPAPSVWQRTIDALRAPRTFQWNLAGAIAATVVLLAASAVVMLKSSNQEVTTVTMSPPSSTRVLVRLVVLQPDAMSVEVAGDFNGWDPRRTPLEPLSGGAWAVTIPLQPGRYEYMFVVNGREWVGDPLALEQNDDGFGSQNSVLDVRSPTEASL